MLELYPYHNVHTFISLSSPQAGQYGSKLYTISIFMYFEELLWNTVHNITYI